jgi:hypothetical protein
LISLYFSLYKHSTSRSKNFHIFSTQIINIHESEEQVEWYKREKKTAINNFFIISIRRVERREKKFDIEVETFT